MRSYILSELEIHNFGPFKGNFKLKDFQNKSIVGVVGEYDGIRGKSNRSGKSFFTESFLYLLTGKSRADVETDLIHNGEDVMWIRGTFINENDDKDIKVVKRGRDITGKGLLELDWIEKSKDAKQAIIDTFGVDPDDFETTSFFKQSDIEGFMKKKPSEQSEDMMRWMDNSHWLDKAENVKKDIKVYRDSLKDVEATKRALEASLDSVEALELQITKLNEEADKYDDNLKEEEIKISSLVEKQNERKNNKNEYLAIKKLLVDKLSEANRNKREIVKIKELVKEYSLKVVTVTGKLEEFKDFNNNREDITRLSQELGNSYAVLQHIKGIIKGVKESKGTCPILGSKCDLIKVDANNDYEKEYNKELEKYNLVKNELEDTKILISLSDEIVSYNSKLDSYEDQLKNLGDIDVSEYETEIKSWENKIENEINKIDELERQIKELNKKADMLSESIKEIEKNISVLEHRIKVYDSTLLKIQEKDKLASQLRLDIADYSEIAIMYSKYGIPADEIDNSLGLIQEKVNMILSLSGLNLSMQFSPEKELKGKEPVCICGHFFVKGYRGNDCPDCGMERQNKRKTEMCITILEDGQERKFKMDSGGGRTLIAFAVRIAISLIKREQGKMNLNMLFLDEVDAPFDDFHLDKLISIITTTLTNHFGYSQIILISHNAKIRDSIDDIVKIIRYSDNTSRLSF